MIKPGFGNRIGNRWMFALEFEVHGDLPKCWNEWWGSLWLWVEGHVVGAPFESETVLTGLDSLQEVALETGNRARRLLSGSSSKEALETVMCARYGSGAPSRRNLVADDKSLLPFEVLPRRTGPFFDGWEAILLEDEKEERFVYRQEGSATVTEVIWPLGTFHEV